MLRVNFSTLLLTQTTRLPILPCHTGSRHLLVPSTACPFSLPCPHLPTLSVTCLAQPSGPAAPPRPSHCTLAQSTSFPPLPRTLCGSRVISTLNHWTHIPWKPHSPTHRHTPLQMSNPKPVLTCLFPFQDLDLNPWKFMFPGIQHCHLCFLPKIPFLMTCMKSSFLYFLFSPLGIFLCFPHK